MYGLFLVQDYFHARNSSFNIYSQVVENNLPEYDSVLVQGRKINGNYLLNFHYARNKTRDAQSRDIGRHSCNNDRLLPPVQRHKYNKEQFIQAR